VLELIDGETVLETERLFLEPLRREHARELFHLYQDPRIYRYMEHRPPSSIEALEERCARLESRRDPEGQDLWLNWVMRLRESRQCIGRVEVTLREDLGAWLAYEMSPLFWGAGYATEACRRVLALLLDDYAVREILATVDQRNERSIRLLERLGFERCGRGSATAPDGDNELVPELVKISPEDFLYRLESRRTQVST
jgi:RimJ/RimL family protein N-acetyltransferase